MKNKIIAKDKKHLIELIKREIQKGNNDCSLNHINVSKVKNMEQLFWNTDFNGDISEWDVSKVTDMRYMFYNTSFNQDISKWNISNVEYMQNMFKESKFNKDISKWNVFKVINMDNMFEKSSFNHDLTSWKPLNLKYKDNIFTDCQAPKPYWAEVEIEYIHHSINSYSLNKGLESYLEKDSSQRKKMKI